MTKITLDHLEYLLKDERKASKEYKDLAKNALTKGEKQRLLGMSKDEARHAGYVQEMIRRRK